MSCDKEEKLDWRDAAGIVQFPDDMPPEKWVRGLRDRNMTRDEVIREVLDASVAFVDESLATAPMFDCDKRVLHISEEVWQQFIAAVADFKRAEDGD